jgi:hypothetical protein
VFLPVQDVFLSPHARNSIVIFLYVALAFQFITSTATLLLFFTD